MFDIYVIVTDYRCDYLPPHHHPSSLIHHHLHARIDRRELSSLLIKCTMQNMRILKIYLLLLYYKEISVEGRTIYGRYKGRTSNARSSYTPGSSDRKLNLGSKSFSGFKRPDGLSLVLKLLFLAFDWIKTSNRALFSKPL